MYAHGTSECRESCVSYPEPGSRREVSRLRKLTGVSRGRSLLKTHIFVYIWVVIGWSNFFFFFNLLARRNFPSGDGSYPLLMRNVIAAALPSLVQLIIPEPPPASSLNLFLAQSLKPQCETVHLLFPNCRRSFQSAPSSGCLVSHISVVGTGPAGRARVWSGCREVPELSSFHSVSTGMNELDQQPPESGGSINTGIMRY